MPLTMIAQVVLLKTGGNNLPAKSTFNIADIPAPANAITVHGLYEHLPLPEFSIHTRARSLQIIQLLLSYDGFQTLPKLIVKT